MTRKDGAEQGGGATDAQGPDATVEVVGAMDPERARQESTDPVGMTARLTRALQNRDVQEQQEASKVLREFARVEGNEHAVVMAGAVPALVRVLQGADPGSGAAELAASALANIAATCAWNANKGAVVVAAGAVPALVRVLQGADPGSGAAAEAAAALANISFGSDARKDAVVESGALPLLVRMLQGGDPGSGAAEQAACALRNIAYQSDAHRDAVVAAGALPLLVRVLQWADPGSNNFPLPRVD